jgi:hypothetical protein
MKLKYFIYVALFITVLLTGCRVKESCELNHTGEISVTNNTGSTLEVYVDNVKAFDLQAGSTKSLDKPVGTYTVKSLSFPDEWTSEAVVIECKTTVINVPEE